MGLLHYVGKNDGYDLEVFLGRKYRARKLKFFIADFDLSQPIIKYDDATVDRLVWSLDAVPYFPNKASKMFKTFSEGYLEAAKAGGNLEIAERVLSEYD